MAYKMRFMQTFDKRDSEAFLALERKFMALEAQTPGMKKGRRFVPVIGRTPVNTLIWEAEFERLADAVSALEAIEGNAEHELLLREQIRFMRDSYVEIYQEYM